MDVNAYACVHVCMHICVYVCVCVNSHHEEEVKEKKN